MGKGFSFLSLYSGIRHLECQYRVAICDICSTVWYQVTIQVWTLSKEKRAAKPYWLPLNLRVHLPQPTTRDQLPSTLVAQLVEQQWSVLEVVGWNPTGVSLSLCGSISFLGLPNQGCHSHSLLKGGGGGGEGPRDFLGSEILAKRDFFWVYERREDFLGREKTQEFFWVLYFSSAQINNNIIAFTVDVGFFWVC